MRETILSANETAMTAQVLATVIDDNISKLYSHDEEQLEKVDTLLRLSDLLAREIDTIIEYLQTLELEIRKPAAE